MSLYIYNLITRTKNTYMLNPTLFLLCLHYPTPCLLDNGSELKNSQMNTILKQLGIKHRYSNPYRPQGNSRIENIHNFLKITLTKFLSSLDAEWDKVLPFACYCFNSTPTSDDLESPFFLIHGRDPLEGHTRLFCSGDNRYMGDEKRCDPLC